MAIDFGFFFWSKDDIRSIIWSILSSSFRSTLWVSGLFLLAQQSLLARRPWVDHHEYDAFYYSVVGEQSHGSGVCLGPAVYVGCLSTGNDYA